jgi:hypothetical protein
MTRVRSAARGRTIAWTVFALLVAIRLPSLVEPAGGDQALYAYVGQRIDAGDVPYRNAWDQKPPAIHVLYAGLWVIWPHDSVVAAADLVAAVLVATLLVRLGRRLFGAGVGEGAACLFLVLGNPAAQRLSGVWVRGQCETFIALAVTAALVLALDEDGPARPRRLCLSGACLALAFWLKYNAGVYLVFVSVAVVIGDRTRRLTWRETSRRVTWIVAGFGVVGVVFLGYFAAHGALTDLWLATVVYNLQYSQETYQGVAGAIRYIGFPFEHALKDPLWYFGGLGCLVLAIHAWRATTTAVTLGWCAAASASILVNGARDLPQYFIQAHPALALAAAAGLAPLVARDSPRALRLTLAAFVLLGLWRVGDEPIPVRLAAQPGVVENTRFDLDYALGRIDRSTYLARFQQRTDAKYVPLAADALASRIEATTRPADTILVFGFAGSVYVHSHRRSASRFFWSRPVEVEFAAAQSGYGSAGLFADLTHESPSVVALQKHWGADLPDPIDFFLSRPNLRTWLDAGYVLETDTPEFAVYRRRS